MKKKFIYFLCNIGLYTFAYRIDPQNAARWKGEQIAKKLIITAKKAQYAMETMTTAIREFSKGYTERKGVDK